MDTHTYQAQHYSKKQAKKWTFYQFLVMIRLFPTRQLPVLIIYGVMHPAKREQKIHLEYANRKQILFCISVIVQIIF